MIELLAKEVNEKEGRWQLQTFEGGNRVINNFFCDAVDFKTPGYVWAHSRIKDIEESISLRYDVLRVYAVIKG